MNGFLSSIAEYLFNNYKSDFKNISLVFPNRRSGVFFTEELKKIAAGNTIWIPDITTINDFMSKYSDYNQAEHIQLLSELYLIYKKTANSSESFDNFLPWGEILLSDFNDIDKYLVNAESVFINVKNFKSIENTFDFLTDEQKLTLKRFFDTFDDEKSTKLKENFKKIWEIMLPLYEEFKHRLHKKQLAYEGMIYRNACDNIKNLHPDDYKGGKMFFIGFNAITPAEEEIFTILKNIEKAVFFWDYDNYYIKNKNMEAGLFLRKFIKKFPPEPLNKSFDNLKNKNIQVISASTNHAQIFKTSNIIADINTNNYSDTAIILSDEELLLPMLNNIPDTIKDINITMGYPVKDSLSANFIEQLIVLQQNIKIKKDNKASFYYKNVISILRHPFVVRLYDEQAQKCVKTITEDNLYYVDAKNLSENQLFKLIFKATASKDDFVEYIENLLSFLYGQLWIVDDSTNSFTVEKEFLYRLWTQIQTLHQQLTQYNIDLQLTTYFHLLRKVIKSLRVPFEGEPVSGLQIMGFLETRNLDFKNIVILSVNEGVIPSASRKASFIPYSLRKGFNLPAGDFNDAVYAYYFYRIMQNAENVFMLYNQSAGGMATGEKSRLIYQLEYNNDFKVETNEESQNIEVISNREISIEKDDKIWQIMQKYLQNNDRRKLSPSALSSYLQCSLQFYFKAIAGIRESDEVEETVDARLFGNIFHKAAEKVYKPYFETKTLIDKELLNKISKNKSDIHKIINQAFTETFYGSNTTKEFKIEGKNRIVFDVIEKYLLKLIEKDIEYAPFSIVGLEKNVSAEIDFTANNTKLTAEIGGQIDRMDRTDSFLRIIDYKTGNDELKFKTLQDVFNRDEIKKHKAIFQTFLYSYVVNRVNFPDEVILPMVYQVKKLFTPKVDFEITSKECQEYVSGKFSGIKNDVEDYIKDLLSELFDREIPFTQTENTDNCKYCNYKDICGR